MSERDKKLLVYLGALLILAGAYFLVGRPFLDKYERLSEEKAGLETTLNEMRKAYSMQEKYALGIEEANNKIHDIVSRFPENNSDEKTIIFISEMEKTVPVTVSQLSFAEDSQNLIGNGEANDENTSEGNPYNEESDNTDKSDEALTEQDEDVQVVVENTEIPEEIEVSGLIGRNTQVSFTYESNYAELKSLLAFIRDYKDRMVISDISINYDEKTGVAAGNIILSQYALLGSGRTLAEIETDVSELGKDNIFRSNFVRRGADGDDYGDNIRVDGDDYFIKLNATNNNDAGKTIGKTNDVPGSSYIQSSENRKEDVLFRIIGSEGKYIVTYSIDNQKYSDTIGEDVEDNSIVIRIISTERQGDDDSVEIDLHVTNKSDLPVKVTVVGDDDDNPRVNVVEKNGDVTVED